MLLPDVDVLLHAHKEEAPEHSAYLAWLEQVVNGDGTFGIADIVLSGFLRIATHPRVFSPPSTLDEALTFLRQIRERPNCTVVNPGPRHWDIFVRLCRDADARGNLVPDAYLAALAIESGSEWITADRSFSRFPGLRWRHPLAAR